MMKRKRTNAVLALVLAAVVGARVAIGQHPTSAELVISAFLCGGLIGIWCEAEGHHD